MHWLLSGLAVGAAEAVPGFSGGTVAVLMRIYQRLVAAIAGLHPASLMRGWRQGGVAGIWRELDGAFLCIFTLSSLLSIWLLSHPISWLYSHYPDQLLAFLLALVAVNLLPLVLRLRLDVANLLAGLAGLGLVVGLFSLSGQPQLSLSWPLWLLAGAGAGLLMILPGVSGGYLLLALGLYPAALEAVRRFDFAVLLPLGLGALTGVMLGARLLGSLLRRGGDVVWAVFYGMVAGSVVLLWPGGAVLEVPMLASLAAGTAIAALLLWVGRVMRLSVVLLAAVSLLAPVSEAQQDENDHWPVYEISKGENLSMIAGLYSVKSSDLVHWNGLSSPSRIFPGKRLRMPPGTAARTHKVRKGETLSEIALQNRTFIKRLQQLNGLSSPDLVYPGQVLRLAPELQIPEHVVRSGDTLFALALRYNRTLEELAQLNSLKSPYDIRSGQRIRLSGKPPATAARLPAAKPPSGKVSSKRRAVRQEEAERKLQQADRALRWQWPSKGQLTARFHPNRYKGVDIVSGEGSAVLAAADGEVRYAGDGLFRDYGWLVILSHGRYLSIYAHNRKVLVKEGQKVKRGQRVALMGSSGSERVKLHFQIKYRGRATDPLSLLPKRSQNQP